MLNSFMKKNIILIVLYLGFISIGLPDQILGIAWPTMRMDFSKSLDAAGILISITCILAATFSFLSGYLIKKYSTAFILSASCLLTATGLLGYGISSSWMLLVLFSIPLGAGAGVIDTVLNDYVAKNYTSCHMNWLHGFWGVGATIGPAIMTYAIVSQDSWRVGYFIITGLQIFLFLIFVLTAKMWQTTKVTNDTTVEKPTEIVSFKLLSLIPTLSVLMFFLYTTVEFSIGVWFYSVLVEERGISATKAGSWIVTYWAFLTIGRFVIGAFSTKIGNRKVITYGLFGAFLSMCLLLTSYEVLNLLGLACLGFCLAGLYPSMMHETPCRVGQASAGALTGCQTGMSLLGIALLTPIIGIIIDKTSLTYLIPILLLLTGVMILMNKVLNKKS